MQARAAAGGFVTFPEPTRGHEGPRALGEVLRPLQPGDAVLQQPVGAGAGPHRRGAPLRARQGRAPADPRADGRDCSTRVDQELAGARRRRPGLPRDPRARAARQPQHSRPTATRPTISRGPSARPPPSLRRSRWPTRSRTPSRRARSPSSPPTASTRASLEAGQGRAARATARAAKIVAPRLGTLKGDDGDELLIDFSLLTASSVLFDAVYVPGGADERRGSAARSATRSSS